MKLQFNLRTLLLLVSVAAVLLACVVKQYLDYVDLERFKAKIVAVETPLMQAMAPAVSSAVWERFNLGHGVGFGWGMHAAGSSKDEKFIPFGFLHGKSGGQDVDALFAFRITRDNVQIFYSDHPFATEQLPRVKSALAGCDYEYELIKRNESIQIGTEHSVNFGSANFLTSKLR